MFSPSLFVNGTYDLKKLQNKINTKDYMYKL